MFVLNNYVFGGLTVFILYLIYWYRRPKKFPPGPRGLPFVGYLPFLSKKVECDVRKISDKLGPIISMRLGPNDVVFLNDFNSIQNVRI